MRHTQQTSILDLVTDTHRADQEQPTILDAILQARAADDAAREDAADQRRQEKLERDLSRGDVEW